MKEGVKLGITIAAFVVITLGLLVWLYFQVAYIGWEPFKGEESLARQMEKLDARMQVAQEKIAEIPEKEAEMRRLSDADRSARQLLPRKRHTDELLQAIERKAKESGVLPIAMRPERARGQGMAAGDYEEMSFSIEILGTYDQIGTFVNKMEEFEIRGEDNRLEKRFFAVKDIDLEAQEDGLNRHGILKCSLIMQTYRYTGLEDELGPAGGAAGG